MGTPESYLHLQYSLPAASHTLESLKKELPPFNVESANSCNVRNSRQRLAQRVYRVSNRAPVLRVSDELIPTVKSNPTV